MESLGGALTPHAWHPRRGTWICRLRVEIPSVVEGLTWLDGLFLRRSSNDFSLASSTLLPDLRHLTRSRSRLRNLPAGLVLLTKVMETGNARGEPDRCEFRGFLPAAGCITRQHEEILRKRSGLSFWRTPQRLRGARNSHRLVQLHSVPPTANCKRWRLLQ